MPVPGSVRRRALVALVALVAGWWLLATGPAASAHGALERAEPTAGASLQRSPGTVRLTFTEAPERRLSSVRVLDAAGRPVGGGHTAPAPGDPRTLQTTLAELPAGTYTVSWRIVSAVDGHPTTGAFSFGVGTPAPAGAAGAGVPTPKLKAPVVGWPSTAETIRQLTV